MKNDQGTHSYEKRNGPLFVFTRDDIIHKDLREQRVEHSCKCSQYSHDECEYKRIANPPNILSYIVKYACLMPLRLELIGW